MPWIIPQPDQPLWQLGEELAALGGLRGRDYSPAPGPRWYYQVPDEALYQKWVATLDAVAEAPADPAEGEQSGSAAEGTTGAGTDPAVSAPQGEADADPGQDPQDGTNEPEKAPSGPAGVSTSKASSRTAARSGSKKG